MAPRAELTRQARPDELSAQTDPSRSQVRRPLFFAGLLAVALVVLTSLVSTGALMRRLDRKVLHALRPHDEWGAGQRFADRIVEGLKPTNTVILLAVIAIAFAIKRRSWWPLLLAVCCQGAIALGTLVLKAAVGSSDPHHERIGGGSFPSGHTAQLLVTFGVLALLMSTRRMAIAAWILTAVVTVSMALALLFEGAHWTSDVIGGALLAGIVLLLARAGLARVGASPCASHVSAMDSGAPNR